MSAEQLLDVIDAYLEQAVARPTVTLDEAIRAVRALEAEIASLRADAVLGAMVRRMPAGSALCRYDDAVPWRVTCGSLTRYDTPEAAIRAAMLKEAGIHE